MRSLIGTVGGGGWGDTLDFWRKWWLNPWSGDWGAGRAGDGDLIFVN
jgi:hypothetical protein